MAISWYLLSSQILWGAGEWDYNGNRITYYKDCLNNTMNNYIYIRKNSK